MVEKEAQAVMGCTYHKPTTPNIRLPLNNGVGQFNELTFIGCKLGMARRDRISEERDGPDAYILK